jgi:phosphoribosylformylglycinamidine synthase
VDLAAERALAAVLAAAAGDGLLAAAHDLSDGGLAIALAESCLAGATGAQVSLPGDPFTMLFSESPARVVAEVAPGAEAALAALCERHMVPLTGLGAVGGDRLEVTGCFAVTLDELAAARAGVLPALFG